MIVCLISAHSWSMVYWCRQSDLVVCGLFGSRSSRTTTRVPPAAQGEEHTYHDHNGNGDPSYDARIYWWKMSSIVI
jgi:hypothetical protein